MVKLETSERILRMTRDLATPVLLGAGLRFAHLLPIATEAFALPSQARDTTTRT